MTEITSQAPILFICASDTLVRLLLPIAEKLLADGRPVAFAKLQFTDECAEFELATRIPRSQYVGSVRHAAAWLSKYSAIVMGNDWGREIRALILLARQVGVPTICVQESVINLTDHMRRMRYAQHVLVQGKVSAEMLKDRARVHVTGNPRYQHLGIAPRSSEGRVLLNCNFTYGVEEDRRDEWLRGAINACDATGSPVTILQHPRDVADLSTFGKPVIRTSAATIHQRLREGDTVVTRFSSLIHEAIALGRPAVYFNPHKESVGYDFGKECAVLRHASDMTGLAAAIRELRQSPPAASDYEAYLRDHIRPLAQLPSDACAATIEGLVAQHDGGRPEIGDSARRLGLLTYCIAEKLYLLARGRL